MSRCCGPKHQIFRDILYGANGAPPGAPVQTAITNIIDVSFSANWGAVANATGYKITVMQGGTPVLEDFDVGNVTTYSVTGLTANTAYDVHINAYNSAGDGPDSNIESATTYDADAWAFINNLNGKSANWDYSANPGGVSDLRPYVNLFFLEMKGLGEINPGTYTFYNSNIIKRYPRVGQNAACHATEMKALTSGSYSGGVTHGINGCKFNGTNGFFDPGINPSSAFSSDNSGGSVYIVTAPTVNSRAWGCAVDTGTPDHYFQHATYGAEGKDYLSVHDDGNLAGVVVAASLGNYTYMRISSTKVYGFRNETTQYNNVTDNVTGRANLGCLEACLQYNTVGSRFTFSNARHTQLGFEQGLTAASVIVFQQIINFLETACGRNTY